MNKLFRLFQAGMSVGVNALRIKAMRATRIASKEGAYHPSVALHNDAAHQKKLGNFCPSHSKPLWVRRASGRNPRQTSCLVCSLARLRPPPYRCECGFKAL